MSSRPGDFRIDVDEELRRRGYYTSGIRQAIKSGWEQHKRAEQQYSEVVDRSNLACRRSDLTTEESFRLYSSYFDDTDQLSDLNLTYLLGEYPSTGGASGVTTTGTALAKDRQENTKNEPTMTTQSSVGSPGSKDRKSRTFVEKAARKGIAIRSQAAYTRSKLPPLFAVDKIDHLPEGFEQINDDLFARRDNKFLVLNGAAVGTWQEAVPKTKVMNLDKIRTMLDALGQSDVVRSTEEKAGDEIR